MYSLSVPIPGDVSRRAEDLRPALLEFATIREHHSLVCKRLGDAPPGGVRASGASADSSRAERSDGVARLRERVRTALAGAPAFEARISGIDYFERPTRGEGPVVYFAVESPGLRDVHERLLEEFPPVEEMEGDEYVPHVTLARGGDVASARRLAARDIEPVTWTVSELILWDATYEETVAEFPLPA